MWGAGRGVISLLHSLEEQCPHAVALAASKHDAAATRPWVPSDASERNVMLAYKRAAIRLHPDRLSSRDLSVRIEAEEHLKVLSEAFAARDSWDLVPQPAPTKPQASWARSESPVTDGEAPAPSVSRASSGGTDLRDEIFNHSVPMPRTSPVDTTSLPQEVFADLGGQPRAGRAQSYDKSSRPPPSPPSAPRKGPFDDVLPPPPPPPANGTSSVENPFNIPRDTREAAQSVPSRVPPSPFDMSPDSTAAAAMRSDAAAAAAAALFSDAPSTVPRYPSTQSAADSAAELFRSAPDPPAWPAPTASAGRRPPVQGGPPRPPSVPDLLDSLFGTTASQK